MPSSEMMSRLLLELEHSLRALEAVQDGGVADILRPIVLRRRRAVSALRTVMRGLPAMAQGRRAEVRRPVRWTIRDICREEQALLSCYDAAIAACPTESPVQGILGLQRAETEQAFLYLTTRFGPEVRQ